MNKVLNYYNKVKDYNIFTKEELEHLEELNNYDKDEVSYIRGDFLSLLTSIRNNNYHFDFLRFLRNDYHMLRRSKWRIDELRRYLKQQSQDKDTIRLLALLKKLSKNFDYKYLLEISNTEKTWLYNHYPNLLSKILLREDECNISITNGLDYEIIIFSILDDYELGNLLNTIIDEITCLTINIMSIPTTLIKLYNKALKVCNRVSKLKEEA